MRKLPPYLVAFGMIVGAAFASGSASASSFLEYCQNSNTSKAGKLTLKIIADKAESADCAKMDGYLKRSTQIDLEGENLTDVTALSFFSHFKSISLTSKKDIDLSKLGEHSTVKSLTVAAPITKLGFFGENLENLRILQAPKVTLEGFSKYQKLKKLVMFNAATPSFAEINKLSALVLLDLSWSNLSSISQIGNLKKLRILHVPSNHIVDLSGIEGMTELEDLTLAGNHVSDLSPLASLKGLSLLDISQNPARDFSPLYGLTELRSLRLDSLELSDLSPLARFKKLMSISVRDNEITDVSPLAKIPDLLEIDVSRNLIRDLSPLETLEELHTLDAGSNYISQVPKLASKLSSVGLEKNLISSLDGLEVDEQSELTGLNLAHNAIQSLKGIEVAKTLHYLNIEGNRIHSLSSLSGMNYLERLNAADNRIYDVKALANLPKLEDVNLSENRITSLAPLKDSAIWWLSMDGNPLGYEFQLYPATCPKDAKSKGVARWCNKPIERSRAGAWVIVIPEDGKPYGPTIQSTILGF